MVKVECLKFEIRRNYLKQKEKRGRVCRMKRHSIHLEKGGGGSSYCVGKESQLSFVPIIILKKTEKERRKRPNASMSHVACTHSQKPFMLRVQSAVTAWMRPWVVDQTRERERVHVHVHVHVMNIPRVWLPFICQCLLLLTPHCIPAGSLSHFIYF